MGKSTTPSFVVSLRLLTTKEDERELEYRFRAGAHLYNLCVKEARKRAHKLLKDAEYKARRKAYSGTKEEQKALFEIRTRYGLAGSYSLESYIKDGRKKFAKHLDSSTCAKISQTVWVATADFLFKDGEQIHFKKVRDFRSMESKNNRQGIRFRENRIKWLGLCIPVRVRKKDVYAKQCLQNHRIKYCRIHRKWHKHKWRYYVELIMEGIPPLKERRMGKGRVGIDIGTSTIAAVSEADVLFKELNDGIEPYIMEGPEFDFVITNSHTPKPEPKPEVSPQKPSKQDPPAKITVKASEIPTGVQSGEAFWLILFCACFSVCVLMLMEHGMKKRKK